MLKKRLLKNNGTTLIEILIATLVFSLALGSLLSTLNVIVDLVDTAKDRTTAITHLTNIMERIRATPFDYITTRFPNGTVNGPTGNPYANITGGYTLANEQIVLTYTNPNSDPLEIISTISWQSSRGRSMNTSLSTFRTR